MESVQNEFVYCEEVIVDDYSQNMYVKDFRDGKIVVQDIDGNEFTADINQCHPAVSVENSGKTTLLKACLGFVRRPLEICEIDALNLNSRY